LINPLHSGSSYFSTLLPAATPLLEAPLTLCFENILKLLYNIKLQHFHVFISLTLQGVLNAGEERKIIWGPCLRNTVVDAPVECGVWPTLTTQVGPSEPVHCHDTFATHQTAIFLGFVYSKLHHRDILLIPNKNGLFVLMKYIYSAKYFLDWKK